MKAHEHRFYANISFIQWSWTSANFGLHRVSAPILQIMMGECVYVKHREVCAHVYAYICICTVYVDYEL